MATKRWFMTLVVEIDEESHPRKLVPDAINECLDSAKGEDIIDYKFVCPD